MSYTVNCYKDWEDDDDGYEDDPQLDDEEIDPEEKLDYNEDYHEKGY